MLGNRPRATPSLTLTKKKRRIVPRNATGEKIVFDVAAREDYLTGFHKRKLERAKRAQDAAEKKTREILLKKRRQVREERNADLARHVAAVNASISNVPADTSTSDGEWTGLEENPPLQINRDDEYTDEEGQTVVTVEEVDVTRHGLRKAGQQHSDEELELESDDQDGEVEANGSTSSKEAVRKRKAEQNGAKRKGKLPKKKKKKFRYESKGDRILQRAKEKARSVSKMKTRKEKQNSKDR